MKNINVIMMVLMFSMFSYAGKQTKVICQDPFDQESREIILDINKRYIKVNYNGTIQKFYINKQNGYKTLEIWDFHLADEDLTYTIDVKNKTWTIFRHGAKLFVHTIKLIS